jgi:hypothetical protein
MRNTFTEKDKCSRNFQDIIVDCLATAGKPKTVCYVPNALKVKIRVKTRRHTDGWRILLQGHGLTSLELRKQQGPVGRRILRSWIGASRDIRKR